LPAKAWCCGRDRAAGPLASHKEHAGAVTPRDRKNLEDLLALQKPNFAAQLQQLARYKPDFARFGGEPPAPRFQQDWFPRLDAAMAYGMVRERAPARIVEIGSGHSTRVMVRAIADGRLATAFTAIDPKPRAPLSGLPVHHLGSRLQGVSAAPIQALASGDFLFIDSSHILRPGSDVELLLDRILPALPAGVVVHIHDIFLPDAYPSDWAWRNYNEQEALAPLLLSGDWAAIFASHYVLTRMAPEFTASIAAALPLPGGAIESSFWMEKMR
jgi:predicted O-methyltransferase YrrM